ncbi:S8 family peptidase [Candidatus Methanoperedens nitratireducens]|uniref:Subtilisin-like serine protease n=1 Tax=Candidatus Methanoperedens nitratireducens TaxID=1392998 RepID=A0A284VMF2_9EURY
MVKKKVIVEIRAPKVPESRLMAVANEITSQFDIEGFKLDKDYKPVPGNPPDHLAASFEASNETVMLVRGEIEEGKEKELESRPNVIKVWTDARIAPTYDCDTDVSKGDLNRVARYLGANKIWAKGIRGKGIVIGICDDGVNALSRDIVIDGWSPEKCSKWGTEGGHGNMTATDVIGMCPEAKIYDIGVLKNPPGTTPDVEGAISNAIAGFQWAIEHHKRDGTPQILSNSWNSYQEEWAPDYARDPNHPFTRKALEAIREGIIVCFSAGNCGEFCQEKDFRCGSDTGSGRSIWGANGHPEVITVGAVNIKGELAGYSSQGPAALSSEKPDLCGITHFKGYNDPDTGTSAATPIVAGVIGLLKCARPDLTHAQVKAVLRKTAKDIGETGFDHNSGYGIVQAYAAYKLLIKKTKPKKPE